MKTEWIKRKCRSCSSQFVIHRDWKNPDVDCGPCKLIFARFVDAIEVLLLGNYFATPDDVKFRLKSMLKEADRLYGEELKKSTEKPLAWKVAERALAIKIWNEMELRKPVLLAIKALRKLEREDAKADLRNEVRAARTSDGTRRWSG